MPVFGLPGFSLILDFDYLVFRCLDLVLINAWVLLSVFTLFLVALFGYLGLLLGLPHIRT